MPGARERPEVAGRLGVLEVFEAPEPLVPGRAGPVVCGVVADSPGVTGEGLAGAGASAAWFGSVMPTAR